MKLFDGFSAQHFDQWKTSVERELKGLSYEETLSKTDPVEELTFDKYAVQTPESAEKGLTYLRASRSANNDWAIRKRIEVKDEKVANKMALMALNQGANSLCFVLQKKNILWSALFENIELNYILCQFETLDDDQTVDLRTHFPKFCQKALVLLNDPLGQGLTMNQSNAQFAGHALFKVNAFGLHQAGANAIQEIAFSLAMGHEYLHQLLSAGHTIDNASAMLRFEFGIGAKYFIESAKFRVFRKLWATIVNNYQPSENCSHACYIYAQTGFVNKSLRDPYTNLLRQTTETMSAILGGVQEITVRAYDEYALEKEDGLSERMALNISNILKEESYFDKVIDPLGGSYSLEHVSEKLEEKAWSMFQEIEKRGGILSPETRTYFQEKVGKTAELRKSLLQSQEQILIGVNKFPNPNEKANGWQEIPGYFGFDTLILEVHTA